MEKSSATRIVRQTFQNPFDKESFVYFIKSLLNHIEPASFIYRGNFIPNAYGPYIKTLERIGKYQDKDDKKIDLLVVHLKKETSLERARTMQRNFIAWYLNGSRGDILKDAALVAFVSPNSEDWRFSLVKMDYRLGTSGEKIKVKQELTPARRFSFLVGKAESSHTAQSQLVPILQDDNRDPSLQELEEAFSIEKVTKEFFEKYRGLFLKVKGELDKIIQKDNKVKQDFKEKDIDTVDFAKKLLGQIVFLYFLQKKGWFGVARDEDWGTGPKDFLRRLFEKQLAGYDNFFNDILEPLFYEALARERDDNFYSRFNCKIPFLNGGLFDPLNDYDWVHTDINLPDELFSNLLLTKEGDKGIGILDIFDRFNFTVKEDEPLDKEVAVDPEMLGKVFENLLEVKDRKSKGTYYTPREIVHYMCQQSLINYLSTELKDRVKKKDIETLIQLGETAIEHDRHISDNGKETPTYSYKLPESVRKNARLIDEKLAAIKVCDPAIGSGAFPVGMMNIIVKTRNVLNSYLKDSAERSTYDFKRHAIASSLYGVDIDLGAVEIAKLRLWLSLIVDEHDIKKIKPLPNLDYKIMQGNSLIELLSPDLVRKGLHQEKNKLIDQLSELKSQYFEATSRKNKINLRDQINELIVYIANYDKARELEQSKNLLANLKAQKSLFSLGPENLTLGEVESKEVKKLKKKVQELEKIKDTSPENHFEWHLNFNEVFEGNSGFDVIIANPPYVGDKNNKTIFKPILASPLGKKFYKGQMDLFYFFIHLGIILSHQNSIISFITTNYYLTADSALKLRKEIKEKSTVLSLINFNELKIFDSAQGQHNLISIFKITKQGQNTKSHNLITKNTGLATGQLLTSILRRTDKETNYYFVDQEDIFEDDNNYIRIQGVIGGDPILKILNKVKHEGLRLGKDKLCIINAGIGITVSKITNKYIKEFSSLNLKTGQGVFVVSKTVALNIEKELIKNFVKNSDIFHYSYKLNKDKLIYLQWTDDINQYPHAKKHLIQFKAILEDQVKKYKESFPWYALNRPRSKELFESPDKIISPYRSKKNNFAYVEEPLYASRDVFFIRSLNPDIDLKYILSLLNSKLYYLWLYYKGKRKGETLEMYQTPLSEIPIKRISLKEQKLFIEIVDKILTITKNSDYFGNPSKQVKVLDYEERIDQMVYKLYNLTPEEIEIIEKN